MISKMDMNRLMRIGAFGVTANNKDSAQPAEQCTVIRAQLFKASLA